MIIDSKRDSEFVKLGKDHIWVFGPGEDQDLSSKYVIILQIKTQIVIS